MGRHRRSVLAFLLVLLVVAGAAAGSAAEPQRVQELGDSIDVRVVNVEAVITDGKGGAGARPVGGRLPPAGRRPRGAG